MNPAETIQALHALLMKAPDAQYDAEGTGMWWCTIDGCDGSDHGLADYILDAIAAGKIPGLALKTYDGTTCWHCEKCGKVRTGRGCMTCLERELAAALAEVEQWKAAVETMKALQSDKVQLARDYDAALAKLAQVTGVDEGAKLRALLIDARDELGKHKFSEDGEYNNDDVIEVCDRIDEALRAKKDLDP